MSDLAVEVGLRAAKVLVAALIGVAVYLVVTGPLAAPGSAELALLSFLVGAAVVLLVETGVV